LHSFTNERKRRNGGIVAEIGRLQRQATSNARPIGYREINVEVGAELCYGSANVGINPPFAMVNARRFYLMMKDGTTAFIQLVYSSMGLSASTQMTSRVFHPERGTDKIKTISSSGSNFQASEDRFSCTTDDMTIDFDKETRTYKVKAAYGEEVVFNFEFVLESDGISCQTFFTQGKDNDGYGTHLWNCKTG